MKIETKYSLNQELWFIGTYGCRKEVPCATCNETGNLTIGGEEFPCPKCNGNKKNSEFSQWKWCVVCFGIIGLIRATEEINADRTNGAETRLSVEYRLDAPNSRNGDYVKEDCLWPSREAAQSECDRRNSLPLGSSDA